MSQYDVVIIGAGPAGMTAAIYAKRANMNVLLLDRLAPGGKIIDTNEIENWPGTGKINGAELAINMYQHTQELEIEFDYKTVVKVEKDGGEFKIFTEEAEEPITSLSVISASGTNSRRLHLEGEEDLIGSSIGFCAICDGAKYKGQDAVIIGGGNSAVDEGIYLAGIVNHLTIITDFDLTADPISCNHLRSLGNVTIHTYKETYEYVTEDGKLTGVRFRDKDTKENEQFVECDGLFLYIGAIPATEHLEDFNVLESHGYMLCDDEMKTTVPGLFGAGDSISKKLRQVVTAASDGAIAAQNASSYVESLKQVQ